MHRATKKKRMKLKKMAVGAKVIILGEYSFVAIFMSSSWQTKLFRTMPL